MPGPKTNEREGTRAVLRHARVSPSKVREVLDLIRGLPVREAEDILRFSERDAAFTVGKVLRSAVANAENNDDQDSEELFVSACFADEGSTIKRWRPRARGRATRIRKRTTHITVIVSRMDDRELARQRQHRQAEQLAQRSRRVSLSRRIEGDSRNRSDRRRGVVVDDHENHDHEDHDHENHEHGEETVAEETVAEDEAKTTQGAAVEGSEATAEHTEPAAHEAAAGEASVEEGAGEEGAHEAAAKAGDEGDEN